MNKKLTTTLAVGLLFTALYTIGHQKKYFGITLTKNTNTEKIEAKKVTKKGIKKAAPVKKTTIAPAPTKKAKTKKRWWKFWK